MSPKSKSSPKHAAPAAALRSQRELQQIGATVLRLAKARGVPETEVHLDETIQALTRFANNTIHQHVAEHGLVVSIRTACDGRTARVTTNRVDEDALRSAIDDCLSLASHQPKDPQSLAMPGKQKYRAVRHFHASTAALTAHERARAVKASCQFAEKRGQVAAGIFSTGQSQTVLLNSRGVAAAYRQTHGTFSVTMQQGSAASWAKGNAGDVRQFDPMELTKVASDKAARAENPVELAPGKFTVILEPAAVLDLVGFLFYDFSATAVADQRSCFANRLGKQLLGNNITITDDVYHPDQLGTPFDGEGVPRQRVLLVDRGVVKNLVYSRQSAKQAHKKPTGHGFALPNEYGEAPMNLVVAGGKTSVEEMIASTDRGLLVTRLWYIREVDPYEKIMTGMTRDGLFLIEKGKIAQAAKNFRFNQSVLEMLRNVELLGPARRATAEEAFEMVVPAMKVRKFHFSEVTKF
ncbi:MAG TPA: TldD/PmbA family protein [Candidatus Sulfotelmatobacter sp.]|nr:TldD/PmbA family protein [Candidatus Sulfotelmatobacter sp.]